jgi:hypothetical protein
LKTLVGLFAAVALVGLATSAAAQPPGSYRESCRDIRMQGSVLTALCRRAGGRGEQRTALNVAHCIGDIGNNNGNLECNGGRPVSPAPSAGYPHGPGYSAPGIRLTPVSRIPARTGLLRAGIWPTTPVSRISARTGLLRAGIRPTTSLTASRSGVEVAYQRAASSGKPLPASAVGQRMST